MSKDEIRAWAKRHGWREDRWGHMKKSVEGRHYRLKFGKRTLRYERKVDLGYRTTWVRLRSGYYGNLTITKEDKIRGMKR